MRKNEHCKQIEVENYFLVSQDAIRASLSLQLYPKARQFTDTQDSIYYELHFTLAGLAANMSFHLLRFAYLNIPW